MIELPWPHRDLSPNTRCHFRAKAAATKAYRNQAYWLTKAAGVEFPAASGATLIVEFYPPDKRRRDVDGMFSSMKAAFDGIADALEVNDHRFDFEIRRREPVKGGKVVVRIGDA